MSRPRLNSQGLAVALTIAALASIIQLQGPGDYIPPARDHTEREHVVWLAPELDKDRWEGGAYTATDGIAEGRRPSAKIAPGTYETRFANGADGCSFIIRTWTNLGADAKPLVDEYFRFEGGTSAAFSIGEGQSIYFKAADAGYEDGPKDDHSTNVCRKEWLRLGEPGLIDLGLDLPPIVDAVWKDNAATIGDFSESTPPGAYRSVEAIHEGVGGCMVEIERVWAPNLGDPIKVIHNRYGYGGDRMFVQVPPEFEVAPKDLSGGLHIGSYVIDTVGRGCPIDYQRAEQ